MKDKSTIKTIAYGLVVIGVLTIVNLVLATGAVKSHEMTGPRTTIETVEYDGCQYLGHKNGGIVIYAHKGNCTNSIHVDNVAAIAALLAKSTNAPSKP